jgi:hypothetical protein
VRIADVKAEIRSGRLLNASEKPYRLLGISRKTLLHDINDVYVSETIQVYPV